MILDVLSDKNVDLRMQCAPVAHSALTVKDRFGMSVEFKQLIRDMHHTMAQMRGIGLSAPQVGIPARIIVANTTGKLITLINPEIVKTSRHKTWGKEGCLSIPGKQVGVLRYVSLTVKGFDVSWEPVQLDARYLLARVLQHEIDHLDGKLMTDGELR